MTYKEKWKVDICKKPKRRNYNKIKYDYYTELYIKLMNETTHKMTSTAAGINI